MSPQLPVSIERYIQIASSGTLEAVPECFAPHAIVRDEGQTYEGVAAIKSWMAATKKNTATPLRRSNSPSMAAKASSRRGSRAAFREVRSR
jgi:hypothetical protein